MRDAGLASSLDIVDPWDIGRLLEQVDQSVEVIYASAMLLVSSRRRFGEAVLLSKPEAGETYKLLMAKELKPACRLVLGSSAQVVDAGDAGVSLLDFSRDFFRELGAHLTRSPSTVTRSICFAMENSRRAERGSIGSGQPLAEWCISA